MIVSKNFHICVETNPNNSKANLVLCRWILIISNPKKAERSQEFTDRGGHGQGMAEMGMIKREDLNEKRIRWEVARMRDDQDEEQF